MSPRLLLEWCPRKRSAKAASPSPVRWPPTFFVAHLADAGLLAEEFLPPRAVGRFPGRALSGGHGRRGPVRDGQVAHGCRPGGRRGRLTSLMPSSMKSRSRARRRRTTQHYLRPPGPPVSRPGTVTRFGETPPRILPTVIPARTRRTRLRASFYTCKASDGTARPAPNLAADSVEPALSWQLEVLSALVRIAETSRTFLPLGSTACTPIQPTLYWRPEPRSESYPQRRRDVKLKALQAALDTFQQNKVAWYTLDSAVSGAEVLSRDEMRHLERRG